MPILKVSDKLIRLSEEKLRLPVQVLPSDVGPCPACGNPTWNGQICSICNYASETEMTALESYQKQQKMQATAARTTTCSECQAGGQSGDKCEECGHPLQPHEFRPPSRDVIGIHPDLELRPYEDPRKTKKTKKKTKAKSKTKKGTAKTDLEEVESDPTTVINQIREMPQEESEKTGAIMSRFDDEFTKESMVPNVQYDQTTNMFLDGPFGLSSQAPAPQVEMWKDVFPDRMLNVQDLDASATDVQGGPGSNAVYADIPFNQPVMQNTDPWENSGKGGQTGQIPGANTASREDGFMYPGVEEDLYKVYEASRDLRTALKEGDDTVSFDDLKARLDAVKSAFKSEGRTANRDKIGEVKVLTKIADKIEENFDLGLSEKATRQALKDFEEKLAALSVYATNGNQETDTHDDVRDLDGRNPIFDRQYAMTPDAQTNVLVPNAQPNQLQLADVPDYYNDGGETGYGLAYNYHREPWPNDPTNPALQGYMGLEYQQAPAQMAPKPASVQEAREKILESIELVDRLERLGMVNGEDRAKHIAKFEQMDSTKLAGFKASIDMLEETGARQPRSQKVASDNNNRMPEMGRMTTASTLRPQDIVADDFLMTLN